MKYENKERKLRLNPFDQLITVFVSQSSGVFSDSCYISLKITMVLLCASILLRVVTFALRRIAQLLLLEDTLIHYPSHKLLALGLSISAGVE